MAYFRCLSSGCGLLLSSLQAHIPANSTLIGPRVLFIGNSVQGKRAWCLSVQCFVRIVQMLLKFRNMTKVSEHLRAELSNQVSIREREAIVHVKEGRGRMDELSALLP